MNSRRLCIGVLADLQSIGPHPYYTAGQKYLSAISDVMGAIPMILPALGDQAPIAEWLNRVDGILLPGAYSNIESHHYQPSSSDESSQGELTDPDRDSTTLPLIRTALVADIPIFGICRGFQELNVALGGSLYAEVHNAEGMMDHREDKQAPLETQYGPAHSVSLTPNGFLAGLSQETTATVNSLHQQGIKNLAEGFEIEARSEDGLIEAIKLKRHDRFVLGVQWHPEWEVQETPFYQLLFSAFKQACLERI